MKSEVLQVRKIRKVIPRIKKADLYTKSFPKYCPLQVFNNRFYGIWIMGNYYGHSSKYYGEFPNSLKKRILSLFPEGMSLYRI